MKMEAPIKQFLTSSARGLFTFLIQINLGEGCLDQSTIEHEMFHALGIARDIILEIS